MDLYDWLLALHVLAAAALVAAEVMFSVMAVGARNRDVPSDVVRLFRPARLGDVLFAVGSIGTIVFGIWLAIEVDAYRVWDAWIIAALVLWAILMEVGRRTGKVFYAGRDRAKALVAEGRDAPSPELRDLLRSSTGLALQTASVVLVLALLVVMIYKPGA